MRNQISKEYDTLVKLFVFTDDSANLLSEHLDKRSLPGLKTNRGRHRQLCLSEIITLAIFRLYIRIHDIKHYHNFLLAHYQDDFPGIPNYPNRPSVKFSPCCNATG